MSDHSHLIFAPAGERPAGELLHRIVIVGGGAGGLELAVRLGNAQGRQEKAEIVLVDPLLTHIWKPLLHEVAAGTLAVEENGVDFLQQARRHHFRFHPGTMAGLDRRSKEVKLAALAGDDGIGIAPERVLWYDTLVIAIGSRENDFGIAGVATHTLPLNSTEDAQHFHRRLLALFARAEMQDRGPVRIVIVGGGATGVELAAELAEAARVLASYGARLRRYPAAVRISLIDTAPRLLSALPEPVARRADVDLRARGVELHLGQRVSEVRAGEVILGEGDDRICLPSDMTVWAAGIRCPDLLAGLDGLESNRLNQLVVTPTLQTTRDPAIFAIGDCASCRLGDADKTVPPKAQAAHQEAKFLADALPRLLAGEPLPAFAFHDRGSLISLGTREVVGNLADKVAGRTVMIEGLLARFSYWALYRRHLAVLLGLRRTLLAGMGHWFSGRVQPRVKLH